MMTRALHLCWAVLLLPGVALISLAPATGEADERPRFHFVEVTQSAGITWVHENGKSSERYLPETMNGGCAFFDYDNDGWPDIYLVNSGESPFFEPAGPLRNALYRNNRDGTFTDVTERAGVGGRGFGMGVAAADYDGDGWIDLFVSGVGSSILYRNNGDGTFTEITEKAGLRLDGWSTSAAWLDYDNDGHLDVYVCGFVTWTPELNVHCGNQGLRGYCLPSVFQGGSSRLYRNNGDGTFSDVSQQAGIANPGGKGLGVVAADINNDGWIDIFQANDTVENYLYLNRGDGTFEEIGLHAGVAYSAHGMQRSGMGVEAQDFNDDGWVDLFVDNIDGEFYSVYRNLGDNTFEDDGIASVEMATASRFMSGWGVRFADLDNDGDHDLIVVNGHPDDLVNRYQSLVTYLQRPLLFENINGSFRNVSAEAGPPFEKLYAARGLALGDFDNDGDSDVLICNNGQAPVLLRNETGNRMHWVGLQLRGRKSNPHGIGARIVYQVEGQRRIHYVAGGGSYLSSHDHRVILGFAGQRSTGEIRIEWPTGGVQTLESLPMHRYHQVVEEF